MTTYNDNWFDVMFDEAVEELEKENEKNKKTLDKMVKMCYNNYGERERNPSQIHKKR